MSTSDKIYWLDNFKGKASGGEFVKAGLLIEAISKVEKTKGKVVGLKIVNKEIELIFEPKQSTYDRTPQAPQKKPGFMDRVKAVDQQMNKALNLNQDIGASDKKLLEGIPA